MKHSTKIIATISFLLLIVVLVIAHGSPASSYELNIYESTPILVWVFLAVSALIGAGILIKQIVNRGYERSRTWLIGLLILLLSRLVLLYIPYIRGYVTWHGDNISHWGYLRDILNSGHFYPENYYPITHSFISQTIIVSNIQVGYAANFSTALLAIFFILAIYLLATVILTQRSQQLLATTIASLVMIEGAYNVFLTPNGWSVLMLPLLFYLYFKRSVNSAYSLLFVLLLIMYPLFHPLSGLMIVLALLTLLLLNIIIKLWRRKKSHLYLHTNLKPIIIPFMLEFVVLITWILSFNRFRPNIQLIWEQITSGGPDVLAEKANALSKINLHGFDTVILYIKLYGTETILVILSLIGLILFIRQLNKVYKKDLSNHYLSIGTIFLFFIFMYLLYILGMPGFQSIGSERIIYYIVMFTPILAAFTLYKIYETLKNKKLIYTTLFIVLVIPTILSSAELYQSPYIINPNAQITRTNIQGMEWFISKKNIEIHCMQTLSNPGRLAEGLLGVYNAAQTTGIYRADPSIPDHFSYNAYQHFGGNVSGDWYFALNDIDRITYLTIWNTVGRFNATDFIKLENDVSVDMLYSNSEMNIYCVHGSNVITK